jgi:hypothetical protein
MCRRRGLPAPCSHGHFSKLSFSCGSRVTGNSLFFGQKVRKIDLAELYFAGRNSTNYLAVRYPSEDVTVNIGNRDYPACGATPHVYLLMFEPRERNTLMSHLKSGFAVLLLTAIVGVAPRAHAAPTLKVMMVGASGTWQAMAVGTFRGGKCPTAQTGANCAHYTNGSFTLTDQRQSLKGGMNLTDSGAIWIVWDKNVSDPTCTSCNVWAYIKVDSIVGNRCYFARPHCKVSVASWPAAVNPGQITLGSPAWGNDVDPPTSIQALFTTGTVTNVAVSEIRPEDAQFGQCRINSQVGGAHDGLDGLGLGSNATGTCPAFGATLGQLAGTDLTSSYPGSSATAHPIAFNISGNDPYSNTAIPAYSEVTLGVSPLIFITARQNHLQNVTNATLAQLQTLFSGANCSGDVLDNGTAGDIDVYVREPLSGTMNTAEYTAFRLPLGSGGSYGGASQETGFTGLAVKNAPCSGGAGHGLRRSVIGTGEEVKAILHSNDTSGSNVLDQTDGIGYAFFSYGNVSSIKGSANFGYLQINGVDPLFEVYATTYDDGESAIAGALPQISDVAACSGAFPCHENKIWKGGLSFPHVRDGSYRQWCVVRLISDGATFTNASALVTSAQQSVVDTVPDFIPPKSTVVGSFTDPGMKIWRSHYTQQGVAPLNQQSGDKGGEEGGCPVPQTSVATKLVMRNSGCGLGN